MQDGLSSRNLGEYLDALGGEQPAPGGGSAAGLVGALAACLAEMLASLTRNPSPELLEAKATLQNLRQRALTCARNDELAYGRYIAALALPKSTDEEKAARKRTLSAAMEESARVPLALAVVAIEILNAMVVVIEQGNKTVLGDADSAIVLAQATVDICAINVRINLDYIKDEVLAEDLRISIEAAEEMVVHLSQERRRQISDRLTA